jgi:uncharacterized protein (DUF302 family)
MAKRYELKDGQWRVSRIYCQARTPEFLKYPTLAIDLPLKALVWEDTAGKVWLSYNSQKFLYESAYARHGPQGDPVLFNRVETALAAITGAAAK